MSHHYVTVTDATTGESVELNPDEILYVEPRRPGKFHGPICGSTIFMKTRQWIHVNQNQEEVIAEIWRAKIFGQPMVIQPGQDGSQIYPVQIPTTPTGFPNPLQQVWYSTDTDAHKVTGIKDVG